MNRLPIRNTQVRKIVKAAQKRGWTFWIDGSNLMAQFAGGTILHTHCWRQREAASSFRQFAKDIERVEQQR